MAHISQDDGKMASHCVQDEDAGFALRWNEQTKQSFVALSVMVQEHVPNTS